ncbi:hypothetical protein [Thermomonospora cellulosilytica]|uniref:Phage-related protein n=1 Tax=Thermomonospora cellulosilytica TaxID=1411118 RepID=A0A7W3R8K4_9ACTN|nr:hypothetical protein [Thermomonospora cellulosilytica]MBA9003659.1 hypothetical protein [Thermomonospora cellulosilytica]
MALRLGELVAIISADDSRFRRTLSSVHTQLMRVGQAGAFVGLAGSATTFAAALAPALGLLAAGPTVLAAFKVGVFALQMALDGLGDTLGAALVGDAKAFEEALAELPPHARAVAAELGGVFFGMQKNVQNAFFAPMRAQSRGLADDLRGPVQGGMSGVGAALGRVGARVMGVAREARTLAFLRGLFFGVRQGIDAAGAGVPVLVRGVRDLAAVFVDDLGRGGAVLGGLMTRAGQWLSAIAQGGRATAWVDNAVDRVGQLIRIARNLGIVVAAVFGAANTDAGDLAGGLERITAQMAAWAQSAEGQAQLASTFGLINQTASELVAILPLLVGPLGLIVDMLEALPGGTSGTAAQFLAWSLAIGMVTSRLGPLVGLAGTAAGGVGRVAGALRDADSPSRRFVSRMGDAASAMGRASAAAVRHAATAAATGARVAASWAMMAARAMANAVRMAAAWVLSMGPVGWIITAVVAAVALVIANWDKVARFFTTTLPNGIRAGVGWIVGFISGAARRGFLGPVPWIIANWTRVRNFFTQTLPNGVRAGLNWVVSFATSLPGRIARAIGNLGSLLYNAGRNVLIGLYNGMVGMGSWLYNAILNLVKRIVPGPVLHVLGIRSPSRLFMGYGANLAQGLALGMENNAGLVSSAATTLAETAAGAGVPIAAATTTAGGRAGAAAVPGGGAGPVEVRVTLDARGADQEMLKLLRKVIRVQGGGNVQLALGGR